MYSKRHYKPAGIHAALMAKTFMKQLLLVVAALLHVAILHCDSGKTVVVSESGIDSETACSSHAGNLNCSNLTMALEGVVSNTTIAIERGNYTLRCSAHHKFNQIKNVTISGLAAASEVMVNCSDGAGLTFLQATTVNIFNVSFYGCGYKHVSNSIVKKDRFAEYNVALFFQMCRNVTLNRVSVSYSKGTAVQFFATIGNNEITWSNFTNNNGVTQQTVGGGVYIEFPYCLPGNYNNCTVNTSTVPDDFISGGTFRISYSNFFYNDARPPGNQSRVFMVPQLKDHISFGRGGGLSVFFKGNSSFSSVVVSHCNFSGNRAIYGGGAFVDFQDYCHDNEIKIECCLFEGNLANQQGGGMRFNFASSITRTNNGLKGSDMHFNRILIDTIIVHENKAVSSGGGMFFGSVRENTISPTNILNISFGNWTGNIAPVGSAISMICWHDVTHNGVIIEPVIQECLFHANRPHHHLTTQSIHNEQSSVGIGAVYLDSIPLTFAGRANFTSNQHTAIVCVNTGIYFQHTEYRFFNNSAYQGGAIALLGNAYFIIYNGTKLEFINNKAHYLGGAIYATSLIGQNSIPSGNCIIQYYDLLKDPNEWNAHFKFINNTAMGKSNAIYTYSPKPCLWGRAFGPPQDDQGMSKVFCWNNNGTTKKRWDYGNNKCDHERMSAPSKFEQSESLTTLVVIPGIWITFNLTILDDFGNNVTNYTVFTAQSLSPNNVTVSDHSHYLGHGTILLHQPNQNVTNGTIALRTINTPNPIEVKLNIAFTDCPPGFKLSQGQCKCAADTNYDYLLKCHLNPTSAYSDINRGYWIGPSPYDNTTKIMAWCDFCFYDDNTVTVKNFNEVQQNLCHKANRTGTLCSKCMENYSLAVNSESYDCIKYDDSISFPFRLVLFILYKTLFSLLLLWLVYRFGIKIASGKYNAPVFFAQMVTTVVPMDLDGALWYPPALKKFFYILYDMLNLELRLPDCFRFCLHPQLEVTTMLALNYCVALLPIVLVITMAIVYNCHDMGKKVWCCYFKDDYNQTHRRRGCKKVYYYINRFFFSNNREYLVSGVASFFVLSYMKIAVTTCMLITPISLVNGEGLVLFMDGSIRYPQDIKRYNIILAFVFCVYLILVPISLLILRYGDPKTSEGFLYHLLKGLQENFKSLPSGDQSQRNLTCCKARVKHRNVHRTGMWRTATFNTETELCSVDFKCCFGSSCFCSCSAHDFRWVSGAYFVLRILMLLSYMLMLTDMIQLLFQFLICCAAAAFFIVFRPYGYNHKEQDEYQQKKQQELTDTSAIQGNAPVLMSPNSPSERYNRLDAAVFLALAVVNAVCIYRYYLITIGRPIDSIRDLSALTLQSVLLFVPAAWFGLHILFDLKERCSGFKKWVKDKRHREGIYEPVP